MVLFYIHLVVVVVKISAYLKCYNLKILLDVYRYLNILRFLYIFLLLSYIHTEYIAVYRQTEVWAIDRLYSGLLADYIQSIV